ncbi:UDP-N-acetylmuramate--L-alanine ligase-like, partial [Ylistrum balloti]|uniref:UDP-N-acetylmuramate--L-alanine ligase-like n=1 Tax=Ylistrum balloti TaxID=509963 RepID=UPI0029058FAE
MAALALLLHALGHKITGSDTEDVFYTDAMLHSAGIPYYTHFSPSNIPKDIEMVIYSAAYTRENNVELAFAKQNCTTYSYPEALGLYSQMQDSWAVIGTHGKTSCTALIGALARSQNLPVSAITGARVAAFNDNACFMDGAEAFIAEVCEYRGHLMNFIPTGIVFLNAEWDHTDYFKHEQEVFQ